MVDDLVSHKIHASDLEAFKRRLVQAATVYDDLEGQDYDKDRLEDRLSEVAPESGRSPTRDRFTAYESHLGLARPVWNGEGWIIHPSETAKRFLVGPEPDVEAFCSLQIALSQLPDGRGLMARSGGPGLEPHSKERRKDLVEKGYKLCPFRLLLRMFEAKSDLESTSEENIEVTHKELYALANFEPVYTSPIPSIEDIKKGIEKYRNGEIKSPDGRSTFHYYNATGLVYYDNGTFRIQNKGEPVSESIRDERINAIRNLEVFFDFKERYGVNLEGRLDDDALKLGFEKGEWAVYFDAVRTLSSSFVDLFTDRAVEETAAKNVPDTSTLSEQAPRTYSFHDYGSLSGPSSGGESNSSKQQDAEVKYDPEAVKRKRERRNLNHEYILNNFADRVEDLGLKPKESVYVDLLVSLSPEERKDVNVNDLFVRPGDGDGINYLFEAKTIDQGIELDQIRKALSQLYEYHYRNILEGDISGDTVLVLLLQSPILSNAWAVKYLLCDRGISICWFDGDQNLVSPSFCSGTLSIFIDEVSDEFEEVTC